MKGARHPAEQGTRFPVLPDTASRDAMDRVGRERSLGQNGDFAVVYRRPRSLHADSILVPARRHPAATQIVRRNSGLVVSIFR